MMAGALSWLVYQGQSTTSDGFGRDDVIQIASVAFAALALLVSVRNRSTAKRALKLSEQQEARRLVPFEVYLAEALRWPRADGTVVHGTSVRLSNPADRPAAIVLTELHVTYAGANHVLMTVKIPPSANVEELPISPLELPIRLDANHATSGWFFFEVGVDLTGGAPVDRYDLVLRDVQGRSETAQVVAFREAPPQ